MKNLRYRLLSLAVLPLCSASAADLFWDANGATTTATGGGGTWTAANTWRDGAADGALGNWSNGNNAVFGGTAGTVTLGGSVSVSRLTFNTPSYVIGQTANATDTISFAGTYDAANPSTSGTTNNTTVNAKVSGTIDGGLVIDQGAVTPPNLQRFSLANVNNDFTGDIQVLKGNLAISSANGVYGNTANKIILNGGGLSKSEGTVSAANDATLSRNIEIAAAGGNLSFNATGGSTVLNITGAITGSGTWSHYKGSGGGAINPLLSGDMSAFTGTCEIRSGTTTVQTTATSGGVWKLTGGTLKLNATDDSHIADGAGKSNLLMNGGTFDLNGKSEIINGLSGTTGIVQNQLAATVSTLTLGAADTSASFGGTIRNSSGTGGTVALTKTGSGTQTLAADAIYSGATTVEGGSLVLGARLDNSPVTVKTGATLAVATAGKDLHSLALEDGSILSAPLDPMYLGSTGALAFSGGTVTLKPTFTEVPQLGTYDFIVASGGITGSATFVTDFSGGVSRISGTSQIVDNAVQVTVTSLGAALTWNNHAGTGAWDLNASASFLNGASNDVFKQYDAVTFGPSSPAGTITLDGSLLPTSVTVDSSGDFTFSGTGSISGLATLTKSGSGTLTVANANTATGGAMVTEGTLAVNGSLGTGEVFVEEGSTLSGTGTVGGPVDIYGTVTPGGAGVGTLSTGAATLSGTYVCDIDGATCDKLAVTGALDLTDATLTLNIVSASTRSFHVIATCTGSIIGNFASVPEGYIVDTSEAGKVTLRPTPVAPPEGTITFETDQAYPAAGEIVGNNADPNGASFSGTEGWALSVGGAPGRTHVIGSSGEYLGGQAIGASNSSTFTSGRVGGILRTGAASITFDAPWVTGGTAVGFMKDTDQDGLFEISHPSGGVPGAGMSFGIGGSPARFQYRDAGFGTEHSSGLSGTSGNWYRHSVTIGESIGGSRTITWVMRNLTTGTDFDFDTATPEIDNWTFTVTDAQFGTAPERSDGIFVRTTSGARIDNIRVTSAEPPPGTAYDTWMDSFPSLAGNDRLPDEDPDQDGVKNLLEFVLNGDPTTSDASILPTSSVSGGNLVFTFYRRDDSEGLAGQTVQYGDSLSSWTDVVIGATDGSSGGATYAVAENGGSPDLITVTIPVGSASKTFVRLLVEEEVP